MPDMGTTAHRNAEAHSRTRLARYLARCLKELGIGYKEAAKDLQIDPRRVRYLSRTSAQLRVLHPLGVYVETKSRELVKASTANAAAGASQSGT